MKIVTLKNKAKYTRLYALAEAIKALKPWHFLYEYQIFAVVLNKDEVFFCSVMGKNKEVYALAMYEGFDSFSLFCDMSDGYLIDPFTFMIGQKTIMLYFELIKDLDSSDKKILAALDYKEKQRVRYPQFRDMTPYYVPYHLSNDRLDTIITVLEQALFILEEASKNPKNSTLRNLTPEQLIDEIPAAIKVLNENGQYEWKYDMVDPYDWDEESNEKQSDKEEENEADNNEQEGIVIPMHRATNITAMKKMPKGEDNIIITTLTIPTPVKDAAEKRPYYPTMIIAFDADTNEVIDDPTSITENICIPSKLQQNIEHHFINTIERIGKIPASISTNEKMVYKILQPYCDALQIEINYTEQDENIATIVSFLREAFY